MTNDLVESFWDKQPKPNNTAFNASTRYFAEVIMSVEYTLDIARVQYKYQLESRRLKS